VSNALTNESQEILKMLAAVAGELSSSTEANRDETIAAIRRSMLSALPLQGALQPMSSITDRYFDGPGSPILIRLYRPSPGRLPVVLYLHGGAFTAGSVDAYDGAMRVLANRTGWAVAAVNYRLAPEYPYPTAPEDCFAAFRHLVAQASSYDIDGDRVVVAGDSAGGLLAAAVALMARDRGGAAPGGFMCLYPNVDMREDRSYPSLREHDGKLIDVAAITRIFRAYIPDATTRLQAYASPVLAQDLSRLPPALIITCGCDPLCDEGEFFAARLSAAGVRTDTRRLMGTVHGVMAFLAVMPVAAADMLQAIETFLGELT
jgi:acetyl esterase